MDKTIDIALGTAWVFDYDNVQFEKIRELCLQEDNWLRNNYTKENLKISDHKFYIVIFDHSGNPMGMAGGKEYNPEVMRYLNRWYMFPNKRVNFLKATLMSKNIISSFSDIFKFIHKTFDHKLFFISMQQRQNKARQQLWWKVVTKTINTTQSSKWKNYDKGLVQVADCEETSCYQNVVYYTRGNYKFEDWNPKVMSYDEHALRMDYEARLQRRL